LDFEVRPHKTAFHVRVSASTKARCPEGMSDPISIFRSNIVPLIGATSAVSSKASLHPDLCLSGDDSERAGNQCRPRESILARAEWKSAFARRSGFGEAFLN